MVFEYLSFRQKVNCMRVSRGWRDYLSKLPKLWLHLDLSGARKPVPRAFVNTVFKRSEYRMSRVTVHRFEHMDVLRNLAVAAKHLTDLELVSLPYKLSLALVEVVGSAQNLKKCIIHPTINFSDVDSILEVRPTLQHAAFHSVQNSRHTGVWPMALSNLHSFTMHVAGMMYEQRFNLVKFFSRTPSLQSLSLSGLTPVPNPLSIWPTDASLLPPLTSLSLTHMGLQGIPLLPPTLQSLEIKILGRSAPPAAAQLLQSHFPDLTHLSLSGYENVTVDFLHTLLDLSSSNGPNDLGTLVSKPIQQEQQQSTKPLVSLSLSISVQGAPGLISILSCSKRVLTPALQVLDVAGMKCDDDDVDQLVAFKTGLTHINLSSTAVTGAAIVMLADKVATLRSIKVHGCSGISGREAIDYAERRGISVKYQMSQEKGERRIRYG